MFCPSKVVQALAALARKDNCAGMALAALNEYDALRVRVARLETELKREKRAQLYGMTDLA